MAALEGALMKMERDYSDDVDKQLPRCKELAMSGQVSDALEQLLALEKKTRLASDAPSTKRVLVTIVQMCFDTEDWESLNENIMVLTKRRGQLKMAIHAMVEECCKFINQTPNRETKLKLIGTLRIATEGKIYVEVERAHLTLELAKMKEEEGDIEEAARVLQELQVETFGSMKREEKVGFILEQMRLCLAKKDYIRTQIICKKISTKFFSEVDTPEVQELKLKYYRLMIEMCHHTEDFLQISKHYHSVYETSSVQRDEAKKKETLCNVILYCLLAPFDNEQSDLLHRLQKDKVLDDMPMYGKLVKVFVTQEIVGWSEFEAHFAAVLKEGTPEDPCTGVFASNPNYWQELSKRVVEHNIRVVAKYYTRISLHRLSELLSLSVDDAEEYLSNLVVKKTIYARIDRPGGVVCFRESKDASEVLNGWSSSLNTLMALVNKATHLIHKEEMVHGATH